MYRYTFTGLEPEEFSGLAGDLVGVQGRASALVEPGEVIELTDPVHHARLEPADDETVAATSEHLAGLMSLPGNTPHEEHPEYVAPELTEEAPDEPETVEVVSPPVSDPPAPEGTEKPTGARKRASTTKDAGDSGKED